MHQTNRDSISAETGPVGNPSLGASMGSFRSRVGLSFGIQAAQIGGLALVYILLARYLGPEGKGTFAVAVLVPTIVASLMGMGLDTALTYFLGRELVPPGTVLANAAITVCGLIGLLLVGALFSGEALVDVLRVPVPKDLLPWMLALVPLVLLCDWLAGVLTGLHLWRPYALAACLSVCIYSGGIFAILAWGGGVHAAVAVCVSYRALRALALAMCVPWRRLGPYRASGQAFRSMFRFGLTGYAGRQLQQLNYRLDLYIVSVLLGSSATGIYATAAFLAEILQQPTGAMNAVLIPAIASGSPFGGTVARASRQMWWITAGAAIGLAGIAPWLIPTVYGDAFTPSVSALWLLLPGICALTIGRTIAVGFIASGSPGRWTLAAGVGLATSVTLDLLLIPRLGVTGAAVAATTAYVLQTLLLGWWYCTRTGSRPWDLIALRRQDYEALTFNWAGRR